MILEENLVAVPSSGLPQTTVAQVGTQTWKLHVRPAAGSSIAVDAWRPVAVLGIFTGILSIVAALAAFWFWREARGRSQLESMQALVASKDKFVATVSHELRTPISAVLGFADLLKDGGLEDIDTDERNEIIGIIADQASDLGDIVADLLVLAHDQRESDSLRCAGSRLGVDRAGDRRFP